MAYCDLLDSCFFFNKQETDMPHTMAYLKRHYCLGEHFRECALHRIAVTYGMDKVPLDMFPNDLNIYSTDAYESQGGRDMLLKIIRTDGTLDTAKATDIARLIKAGEIVAYQYSEWWIELRRERNKGYWGPERRTNRLY